MFSEGFFYLFEERLVLYGYFYSWVVDNVDLPVVLDPCESRVLKSLRSGRGYFDDKVHVCSQLLDFPLLGNSVEGHREVAFDVLVEVAIVGDVFSREQGFDLSEATSTWSLRVKKATDSSGWDSISTVVNYNTLLFAFN